jgi:hypothetical protein
MKIVQVIPELNEGGVERGVVELNREFVKLGIESYIISNGGKLVEQIIKDGGKHITFDVCSKNIFTSFIRVSKLKKLLKGKNFAGAGNTCLYGATGGKLYVRAAVGERFAVRNSGAIAVVEGTGDNPCEYMTGGIAVILGNTGVNFGAGMTGGLAFVYDPEKTFVDKMNQELIEPVRVDTDDTERERLYLKRLLLDYLHETDSEITEYILQNFRAEIRNFWMVKPKNMTVLPLDPDKGD